MKTNKEIIEELIEYYKKQDLETVCRTLANCQVDLNRWTNIHLCEHKERESLIKRTRINAKELQRFLREGGKESLTLGNLDE